MGFKGIPFIWYKIDEEHAKGLNLNLLGSAIEGRYDGVNINGLFSINEGNFNGLNLGGIIGDIGGDLKGVNISGVVGSVGFVSDSSAERNLKGANISGVVGFISGELYGVSYSTLVNYAMTNGRIAIQVGAVNLIRDYNSDGTAIQLGAYNKIGAQRIPGVNIRGWKNLGRSEKKDLEEVIEKQKKEI